MGMVSYRSIWDALTPPEEAAELHAASELLYALQKLVERHGWNPRQTATQLHLNPVKARQLIDGDINAFTLDELRTLAQDQNLAVAGA